VADGAYLTPRLPLLLPAPLGHATVAHCSGVKLPLLSTRLGCASAACGYVQTPLREGIRTGRCDCKDACYAPGIRSVCCRSCEICGCALAQNSDPCHVQGMKGKQADTDVHSATKGLVVFSILRESKCAECGEELWKGQIPLHGRRTAAVPSVRGSQSPRLPGPRRRSTHATSQEVQRPCGRGRALQPGSGPVRAPGNLGGGIRTAESRTRMPCGC